MIVSIHVATGAALGAATGSQKAALAAGPFLHYLADALPHEDLDDMNWEIGTGLLLVAALAAVRGPFDPTVLGALSACSPDVEHLLPLPRKLFPAHRGGGRHRRGAGLPSWTQLLAAGAIVGILLSQRKEN